MDVAIPSAPANRRFDSFTALAYSARVWFVVAAIGQLIFAYYILMLYGGTALRGDLLGWNKVMPRGYTPGDASGNVAIASHLFFAFTITVGGLLQLLPQIRAYAPGFHRWNGRFFIIGALIAALGGLYLIWMRGTVGDTSQHMGTSFNALLIIGFAIMAWKNAVARDFTSHRRWALRLFMAVSGVWFFRVGLLLWLLIHQKPVGFDPESFTGPFLTLLAFAQTLIPLAALELYFRAQRSNATPILRMSVATLVVSLSLATAVGIVGATLMMWAPHL
jgi:Predicted membrane protein (DUF2306)